MRFLQVRFVVSLNSLDKATIGLERFLTARCRRV